MGFLGYGRGELNGKTSMAAATEHIKRLFGWNTELIFPVVYNLPTEYMEENPMKISSAPLVPLSRMMTAVLVMRGMQDLDHEKMSTGHVIRRSQMGLPIAVRPLVHEWWSEKMATERIWAATMWTSCLWLKSAERSPLSIRYGSTQFGESWYIQFDMMPPVAIFRDWIETEKLKGWGDWGMIADYRKVVDMEIRTMPSGKCHEAQYMIAMGIMLSYTMIAKKYGITSKERLALHNPLYQFKNTKTTGFVSWHGKQRRAGAEGTEDIDMKGYSETHLTDQALYIILDDVEEFLMANNYASETGMRLLKEKICGFEVDRVWTSEGVTHIKTQLICPWYVYRAPTGFSCTMHSVEEGGDVVVYDDVLMPGANISQITKWYDTTSNRVVDVKEDNVDAVLNAMGWGMAGPGGDKGYKLAHMRRMELKHGYLWGLSEWFCNGNLSVMDRYRSERTNCTGVQEAVRLVREVATHMLTKVTYHGEGSGSEMIGGFMSLIMADSLDAGDLLSAPSDAPTATCCVLLDIMRPVKTKGKGVKVVGGQNYEVGYSSVKSVAEKLDCEPVMVVGEGELDRLWFDSTAVAEKFLEGLKEYMREIGSMIGTTGPEPSSKLLTMARKVGMSMRAHIEAAMEFKIPWVVRAYEAVLRREEDIFCMGRMLTMSLVYKPDISFSVAMLVLQQSKLGPVVGVLKLAREIIIEYVEKGKDPAGADNALFYTLAANFGQVIPRLLGTWENRVTSKFPRYQ